MQSLVHDVRCHFLFCCFQVTFLKEQKNSRSVKLIPHGSSDYKTWISIIEPSGVLPPRPDTGKTGMVHSRIVFRVRGCGLNQVLRASDLVMISILMCAVQIPEHVPASLRLCSRARGFSGRKKRGGFRPYLCPWNWGERHRVIHKMLTSGLFHATDEVFCTSTSHMNGH
jgi:hypothetical protein